MSYGSVASAFKEAEAKGESLSVRFLREDCSENGYSPEESLQKTEELFEAMLQSEASYRPEERSNSGLSGGEAEKYRQAQQQGKLLGDEYFHEVCQGALKIAECNACMKRIVAAPTAGSCGVLPAVLIPLYRRNPQLKQKIIEGMVLAAGLGSVTAARACLSGAGGGCQAEIGTASAMAAAALAYVMGADDRQCCEAFAMALSNLLGLVCDPVAGLVEIPCIKRNTVGAVNAVTAANMALAGIQNRIPADEVIDAMGEIGRTMPEALRETGRGGLAATPTAQRIRKEIFPGNGE